jgi:succinyl-CoA synthetase beta subunit
VDLFEYQGKQIFGEFNIPTSKGQTALDVEGALNVAEKVGYPVVVKAQVRVGGRGKAGGIKLAENESELIEAFNSIMGMNIKGHIVELIWIEHASNIKEEYYLSITLDRSRRKYLLMLSSKGGVDIEEVAEKYPEDIFKLYIDPSVGLNKDDVIKTVKNAGLNPVAEEQTADLIFKLYECFVTKDAELVEINPLILTTEDKIHALDAKVSLDDDAAFRHQEWKELGDLTEGDERDRLAKSKGLNYVGLDGSVGVIANGAGLAMSTCDVVNQVGGSPANFLDIGGGANEDVMVAALEVINGDPKVKSILVNVFGGIVKCDEVAKGIVTAISRVDIKAPIVIRLDGTNAIEARKILAEYLSDKLLSESSMMSAAKKAVELAV